MQALNIKYTCDYIKDRIKNDSTTFWGHYDEFNTVKNLLRRTAEFGESNSALLIGPSRSGKTTVSLIFCNKNVCTFISICCSS